ncbi:MAG: MATE family efflux transporter [Eubacteriales bacterium]|nr:MATE family efflux transporter [Eubacteriales bacterium]
MSHSSASLTDGPIASGLIRFAIPILLTNLLQQLYNSVDSAVLGHWCGSIALAAVGSTASLINLLTGFFLGFATGAGILFAMHYGAGDYEGLRKVIDSAMFLSLIFGIIMTVGGVIWTEQLTRLMDIPEETFAPSAVYLRIYMSGTVATMVYNVGAGLIRSEGDSTRPLIYLFIGGAVNMILDLLMVAVWDMGVSGAAYATVTAQTLTAVLVVFRLCRMNPLYAFRPLQMRPDRLTLWDITRISIPCGIQSSMYGISNFLVQVKINSFGQAAMAGTAAYGKLDAFCYMPITALGLAISTYVGQNIGAGKYERMKKGIVTALTAAIFCSILISGLVGKFFEPLIHIFSDDADTLTYARDFAKYLLPCIWMFSFIDIFGGAIRGSGQTVQVTVISLLCICLFRVIWLEATLRIYNDILFVYLCYPVSWILCAFVTLWYYYRHSTLHKSVLLKCSVR